MRSSLLLGVLGAVLILASLVGVTALTFRPWRAVELFRAPVPTQSVISPPSPPTAPEDRVIVPRPAAAEPTPPSAQPAALVGAVQITTVPENGRYALFPGSFSPSLTEPTPPPLREGSAPGTLTDLTPGEYVLVLQSEGWPEGRLHFTVEAGESRPINYIFPHAQVEISSTPPGAQIFHGGRWLGAAPLTAMLPLGEQELIARATDRPERKQAVSVQETGTAPVVFNLRPTERPARTKRKKEPPPNVFERMGRSVKKVFAPKDKKK